MKRAIIYLCVLCALCGQIEAANEIRAIAPGVTTLYHTVREIDGDIWYVVGQVFEVFGTSGTMADYDIAMVDKSGGFFVGTMDTNIGAGQYYVVSHQQAGGSPANSDPAIWQEYGDWDGSTWTPATMTAGDVWEELVADHTGELTFGGEVGGLDPNLTLVLADSNEIQTDQEDGGRLDVIWDAIKYKTDLISLVDTVVKDSNDANNFTIELGADVNDAHWFAAIQVEDADDNLSKEIRWIEFYDENSGDPNIWVDEPFSFTPAVNDVVHIMGTAYGGYLYDILKAANQSRGITNVIDNTRGPRTTGTTSINIINEDDFGMPGWP